MPHFINEGCVLQEAEVVKIGPQKAIFRMIMQTANEVNQNRRLYPKNVLNEGMEGCKDRMKRRSFLGELDHPCPSGVDQFDEIRQTTVMLKDVSHMIRDYQWEGNNLMGELETTTTRNGRIFAGLIQDKSGIGLSMRGMASLKRESQYNLVEGPLTIITFDAVSLPSHKSALIDFNEMRFEAKRFLSESITESGGTICTPDGKCYLASYFDKLVETKVIKIMNAWV